MKLVYYYLDSACKDVVYEKIKFLYGTIKAFEKILGMKRLTINAILRGTTGATIERWESIFSYLELYPQYKVLNGKNIISIEGIKEYHLANTDSLFELLKIANPTIRHRVEEEFFVNREIAKEMATTCNTLDECNQLYKFYFEEL